MAATTTEHIRSRLVANVASPESITQHVVFEVQPKAEDDQICIDPPGKIRTHLFIGSRETENCLPALQAAGITHILQVVQNTLLLLFLAHV